MSTSKKANNKKLTSKTNSDLTKQTISKLLVLQNFAKELVQLPIGKLP